MPTVEPYGAGALTRQDRRVSQEIGRLRSHGQLRSAAIDAEVDAVLDKIDAQTTATGVAMGAVVRVAQAQRQLETLAPEASGRLALFADTHALDLAETVADLRHQLRRR